MWISRPNWDGRGDISPPVRNLDKWFDTFVEPINKLLAEGVEVYGHRTVGGFDRWLDSKGPGCENTALLINIQPIKKETAEDVLRDVLKELKHHLCVDGALIKRVNKILDQKE